MGYNVFNNCDNVVSISIPADFINRVINLANLKSLTLFGNITFKAKDVIKNYSSLDSITIVDANRITESAFEGCSGLTYLSIPNSVTSIGNNAFSRCCNNLSSLTIPCRYIDRHILASSMLKSLTIYGEEISNACSQLIRRNRSLTTVTIEETTSIGESAFSDCSGLTSITIPKSVKNIGNSAFSGCTGLTSITIPESVKNIGISAFSGCSGLTSITFPRWGWLEGIGDSAFSGCSGLTSITIPYVTSIGDSAFSGCSGLTSITISNKLTSIGNSAFSDCSVLTSITIPESVTSIGNSAFSGCSSLSAITIPNNVISIGDYAFDGCANLQKANIPTKLTSIGRAAFRNCSGMDQAIIFPNTTTEIADETFAGCSKIPSIRLTSAVTSIGNNAFEGCKSIKSFSFPSKISSIGNSAFRGCSELVSILLSSAVTQLGDYAFADCENLESATINSDVQVNYTTFKNDNKLKKWSFKGYYSSDGAIYNTEVTKLILIMDKSIKSCTLPKWVRKIGPHAFENCTELTRVQFTGDLNSASIEFGDSAFKNCEKLEFVSWPKYQASFGKGCFSNCRSLTNIDVSEAFIYPGAFAGCSSLKTVNIEKCSRIADEAFKDCIALQRVQMPTESLSSIGRKAFAGCKNLTYPWEFLGENTRIYSGAFTGCTSLKKIRVRRKIPYNEDCRSYIYFAGTGTIVYVPDGYGYIYKSILPQCTIYEDYEKGGKQYEDLLTLYNSCNELDYQPLAHEKTSWTGNNVLTDASQLSANFIDDYEGSLDALVDNSDDTYFLSAWDKDNPNEDYHYIQADLKKGYNGLNISFKRRNTSDPSAPTKVHVFGTNTPNDENSWIDCGNYSLNYSRLDASINSYCYDKVRYLRLQVEATTDNAKENGNIFFALNKLNIKPCDFKSSISKWDDGLYYAMTKAPNKDFLSGTNPVKTYRGSTRFLSLSLSAPIKYVVIKYIKTDADPMQAMQLSQSYYDIYKCFDFDADYRYFDNSTGICCAQFKDVSKDFSLWNYAYGTGQLEFWLRSAHFYTRPPKADLMPEEKRTAIKNLVNQFDSMTFIRNEEAEPLINYCKEVEQAAQTGRYADFAEHDYRTFYADYPAVVPLLVKAGIVKEENGELVVDYIYNEGDVIPANTAVILKGNCRGNAYVMEEGTTDAISPEGNLLHGTTEDEETYVDGCDRYYMLSYDKATECQLGFYWNGENGPRPFINKAYKAFLALPASFNALQNDSFSLAKMEKGGVTTGVNNAPADNVPHVNIGVYSLDGRKVDAKNTKELPAGVYIVNGKKVVIK